jgi:hypothetical protein
VYGIDGRLCTGRQHTIGNIDSHDMDAFLEDIQDVWSSDVLQTPIAALFEPY